MPGKSSLKLVPAQSAGNRWQCAQGRKESGLEPIEKGAISSRSYGGQAYPCQVDPASSGVKVGIVLNSALPPSPIPK